MSLNDIKVFNLPRTNLKRQQLAKQKNQSINHNNLFLLRKIQSIDQRKRSITQPYQKYSLNIESRIRDHRRISSENQKLALRLQSQSSQYSQNFIKHTTPVLSRYQRKRSSTSISFSKHRMTTSFQNSSNKAYLIKWKTESDRGVGFTQSCKNTKSFHTPLSIQVSGKRFLVEFKHHNQFSCLNLLQIGTNKKYQLKLTQRILDHLQKLVKENKIDLSSRIICINDFMIIKIPFEDTVKNYRFKQVKTQQRSSRHEIKSQNGKRNKKISQPKLQEKAYQSKKSQTSKYSYSDDYGYKTIQNTKSITKKQGNSNLLLLKENNSSSQIISDSDHSYMYQNDSGHCVNQDTNKEVNVDIF